VSQRVTVVIPARNEEHFIDKTLAALSKQYTRPDKIVVVNDGSQDGTADTASSAGVEVISIIDRGYNAQGKPVLASVINYGLEQLQKYGYRGNNDYVMILGADHILPPNYIISIIDIMTAERDLAVCSGQIYGERSRVPRGSGRIIRADFWNRIGFRYPENYGFETYLLIKAQQLGYRTKVLNNLMTTTQRKTGRNYKKSAYISYGKSLKALGYNRLYSAARMGLVSLQNPLAAFYMLRGYMSHDFQIYEPELRSFLGSIQRERIKYYVMNPTRAFSEAA
jgi:glycosyltransferase involved in cell wall biosynthesis